MSITNAPLLAISKMYRANLNILTTKLHSKYMLKLACIELKHLFAHFGSGRQKPSKNCPSLTKLLPKCHTGIVSINTQKFHKKKSVLLDRFDCAHVIISGGHANDYSGRWVCLSVVCRASMGMGS